MFRNTLTIPTRMTTFRTAIAYRNEPETSVPIHPVTSCRPELSSLTGPVRERTREREHVRGVAQRTPEAPAQRRLAIRHALGGRIGDGRDVVGVKGVPHPERARRHSDPDCEYSRRTKRVVVRHNQREQR